MCALRAVVTHAEALVEDAEAVVKQAAAAYLYLYPLVTFGVSYEVLTNVEKPTWETLSAPLTTRSRSPVTVQ